jgi:hypothetical protein
LGIDDDPMPSLTAGRLQMMDEDAKVHWAETVDKARYRQFTISGLVSLVGYRKSYTTRNSVARLADSTDIDEFATGLVI